MGQQCSYDHATDAAEENEVLSVRKIEEEREKFAEERTHYRKLEASLRKEIQVLEEEKDSLENDKVSHTRELKIMRKRLSSKEKELSSKDEENLGLQDLLAKTEDALSELRKREEDVRLRLREAHAELDGSKYKKERAAIAKMKTEAKKKKTELKAREKACLKKEKEAKKVLEQQEILEKRLEDVNRREKVVQSAEEVTKAQVAKHMHNVQQTEQMKAILQQMNEQVLLKKKELHDLEENIRIKQEQTMKTAEQVLRKESDIRRKQDDISKKHEEINKMHAEKERGVMELRAQLTSQRQHETDLEERQRLIEATAKLHKKEEEEVANAKRRLTLQQHDLASIEADLKKREKELAEREAEVEKREEAVDEDEAEIEVKREALEQLNEQTRRNATKAPELEYYQSKTRAVRGERTSGDFKVKGLRSSAIQADDRSNIYAQMHMKASEKRARNSLEAAGESMDNQLHVQDQLFASDDTAEAGDGTKPPLPPRPTDAPRRRSQRKSELVAPPNLPKFSDDSKDFLDVLYLYKAWGCIDGESKTLVLLKHSGTFSTTRWRRPLEYCLVFQENLDGIRYLL